VCKGELEFALRGENDQLLLGEAEFGDSSPAELVALGAGLVVFDHEAGAADADAHGHAAPVAQLLVRPEKVAAVVAQTLAVAEEKLLGPAGVEAAARLVLLLHVVAQHQRLLLAARLLQQLLRDVMLHDEVVRFVQLREQKSDKFLTNRNFIFHYAFKPK
jgi:hypothetical protein